MTVLSFLYCGFGFLVNAFAGNAVGAVNVALATLLMYGLGRIHGKIESLKRDRELEE